MITCRCNATWTGVNRAHCSACHNTFGGVTSFDAHRKGGRCTKPASLGLHNNGKGIWVSNYSGPDGD
jgi:hypothetical protein